MAGGRFFVGTASLSGALLLDIHAVAADRTFPWVVPEEWENFLFEEACPLNATHHVLATTAGEVGPIRMMTGR